MKNIVKWLQSIRQIRAAYAEVHGRKLRLMYPRYFTEKISWRKLFDDNPLFILFSDKLATRDWISDRIGTKYLAPLVWSGTAEAIPFAQFEPPYFLKSSHASGHSIMVTTANLSETEAFQEQAAAWLQIDWFDINGERGYKKIPPRLMVEKALVDENGERPLERKFFVFDGTVTAVNTVFVEDGALRSGAFPYPGLEVPWLAF